MSILLAKTRLGISAAIFLAVIAAHKARSDPAPKHVDIPSVASTNQKNGVTAGYVNSLTQNVLPSLVRGPQLETLKNFFRDGARLYRLGNSGSLTDTQIDENCSAESIWINNTFNWLNIHVSEYAAERFVFSPTRISLSYLLPGEHAAGEADKYGTCRENMSVFLVNLDQLMRDPSIYPEVDETPPSSR